MNENKNSNQNNKPNFINLFDDTIRSFLDPNLFEQRDDIEKQLNEWKSNLVYVPPLIDCIQVTEFSSSLFFSSLCIKFLLEKFTDDIELSLIQEIFSGITYRLHHLYGKNDTNDKDKIADFYASRVNLIKCASLVQIYFPEFIEEWHNFSAEDSKILFCFLFEEEERQIPDPNNVFMKKIADLTEDNIKQVLKNSEMSTEWLVLFTYALKKAQKIKQYSEFLPRLTVVPNDPKLYPRFIDIFLECISNEYFFLSKKSADFLERIFDICLDIIKILISPPLDQLSIQMASFIWKEIIDYDAEFIADHYSTFGQKAIDFLAESLRIISYDDDEFFTLVSSVGEPFNFLIENKPTIFCNSIFKFLSILIDAVNNNPNKYMSGTLAVPFFGVSKNSQTPQVIQFYDEILKPCEIDGFAVISPGATFAVSSSSEAIKAKYACLLADNLLENSPRLPTGVLLNFIGECCQFCGQKIDGLIDFAFNSFDSVNGQESSRAIVRLCKNYPSLVADQDSNRLQRICEVAVDQDVNNIEVVVNVSESLLYMMLFSGAESEIFGRAADAAMKAMVGRVGHFYDSEDMCSFCLELMIQYSNRVSQILNDFRNIPMMMEFLTSLCSAIIDAVNITNVFYEFDTGIEKAEPTHFISHVQEQFCEFVSASIDSDLIANKQYLMAWLGEALQRCPVTAHLSILKKLFELFPTEKTLNFIFNAENSNDNDLMLATLNFVKFLAQENWKQFDVTFTQEFLFAPLNSLDTRIVDCALEIISAVIDIEPEFSSDFFINNHLDLMCRITDGIFTNFQDIEIRKSINIWIKLFENHFVHPNEVAEYIQTKIPEKGAELHSMKVALNPEEFLFDRMQLLKAINSLKATLM